MWYIDVMLKIPSEQLKVRTDQFVFRGYRRPLKDTESGSGGLMPRLHLSGGTRYAHRPGVPDTTLSVLHTEAGLTFNAKIGRLEMLL